MMRHNIDNLSSILILIMRDHLMLQFSTSDINYEAQSNFTVHYF